MLSNKYEDGLPTDALAGFHTRHSMTIRRDSNGHRRSGSGSSGYINRGGRVTNDEEARPLHDRNREAEDNYNLEDLAENSDEERMNGNENGNGKHAIFDRPPVRSPRLSDVHEPPQRPRKVIDRTSAIR